MDNTLAQHRSDFYSSMKTTTYLSKQSFTSGIFNSISKDTTDSCLDNGTRTVQNKCVSYETTMVTTTNGQTKCVTDTTTKHEYVTPKETKSFIQQRVERLYGPGALAQGFFITKPQKSRILESENKHTGSPEKHSKSTNDRLLQYDSEPSMKQSTSSPTLPVLRHLRPEFRAQLPAISPRRGVEGGLQKSITVPKLKEDHKINGHTKNVNESVIGEKKEELNGSVAVSKGGVAEKNGHYFLKVLEDQTKRLLELASRVESDIDTPDLSEEVIGKLRSTSGKARLLVSQKMQQFKGLCTNNINQIAGEAFPTTNEDLQGFWDMVMLQVDQVDALFREIDALRSNNWKEPEKNEKPLNNGTSKTKKLVARSKAAPSSAANEGMRKKREEQRKKMLEDRRKAMKSNQQNVQPSIEIFVPENSS